MDADLEIEIAPLLDAESGKLFSPALVHDWDRPESVELRHVEQPQEDAGGSPVLAYLFAKTRFRAELRIFKNESLLHKAKKVKPSSDLLEKFLSLHDASDEAILKFASKYGALEIFTGRMDGGSIEYCDVWRYFARAMSSILALSCLPRDTSEAKRTFAESSHWILLGLLPDAITRRFNMNNLGPLVGEARWFAMTYFIRRGNDKAKDRDQDMLVRLLNSLLELGKVRPWVIWPPGVVNPHLVYSSPQLFSFLTLQLCLRVARMNAFVICTHCQKQYMPTKRAPKTGFRNFCPECRNNGVPKQYALKDFRQRQRSENDV